MSTSAAQTRAFTTVFLIEMWERFGFYGMQVLMVTYMMKRLGFIDTHANLVAQLVRIHRALRRHQTARPR